MTGVLARMGNTDAQGQCHVTAEAETEMLPAASPGTPGTTRSWQRQERSSLKTSGGAQPCQCFDFRLLASRTVREYISVILCVCVCVCVCVFILAALGLHCMQACTL